MTAKNVSRVRSGRHPSVKNSAALSPKGARRLTIGLPKGSLQDATVRLFERAGFKVIIGSRSYAPTIDDPELLPMLLRAQEMASWLGIKLSLTPRILEALREVLRYG